MPDPSIALVTGGAGFVGTHLIRALLARWPSVRVVSLDNYYSGSRENHVDDVRVQYLDGNTIDIISIWSAQQGVGEPDVVFHLGEYSRIVQSFGDFDEVWEFNLRGTKEVVRFAHEHGCRLVYAGSSSKFGNDGADENLSPYAWTKAKNIEYLRNFSAWFGLDYVVTYFYNVYGPGQIRTGRYATVIGIFEAQLEAGESLTVVSPGTQTRDFTHVDDIVDGIIAAYERGTSGHGYQLGTGTEWPIIEVAEMFGTEIAMVPTREGERQRGRADVSIAKKALGWEPQRNLRDYIAEIRSAARR